MIKNKTIKFLIISGLILFSLLMFTSQISLTNLSGQSINASNASICWIEKDGKVYLDDDIDEDARNEIFEILSSLTVSRSILINTSSLPLTFQESYSNNSICEVLIRLNDSEKLIRIIEEKDSSYIIIMTGKLFCYKSTGSSQYNLSVGSILSNYQ